MNDGSRTDPKHPDDITHTTAVERGVHDTLLDRWQTSGIVIRQQKNAPGAVRMVTPIALGAIRLLAIFDHADPLALGALHGHNRHRRSPLARDAVVPGRVSHYQLD
jgi:hypothetical protein